MTIQQNMDYRVSVMDKVGVKITDADGTQRPIVSSDLEIAPAFGDSMRYVWIVTEYMSVYPNARFIFSNGKSANQKAKDLRASDVEGFYIYEVTKHEVLS